MKNRGRTFYISVAQNIENCSKTVDLTYIFKCYFYSQGGAEGDG